MVQSKTFLLGLGAQKAGTTWLHGYLAELEGADFGFAKEYHILDAQTVEAGAVFSRQRRDRAEAILKGDRFARGRRAGFSANPALWASIAMEAMPELYLDAFAGRLSRRDVWLTGDITPSYAALAPDVLAAVRRGFADRGVQARAVFLMRDPVDRCFSAVRMDRRNRLRADPEHRFALTAAEQFEGYYASAPALMRTRYDRTLAAIEAAFGQEDSFIGFYETLFTRSEIERLSAWLGCAPGQADFNTRLNASADTGGTSAHLDGPLPAALAAEAAAFYEPVYRAVADIVGVEPLAAIWPRWRALARAAA